RIPPPAGAPVRIPECGHGRVLHTRTIPDPVFNYLKGFRNSPLAQESSCQPLAPARKALGQMLAVSRCFIEPARRYQRIRKDKAKPRGDGGMLHADLQLANSFPDSRQGEKQIEYEISVNYRIIGVQLQCSAETLFRPVPLRLSRIDHS